jgi:hypothetical protein
MRGHTVGFSAVQKRLPSPRLGLVKIDFLIRKKRGSSDPKRVENS